MSDQSSNSPKRKSAKKRAVQREQGQAKVAAGAKNTRSNPVVADETYGDLRQDNRVVMRHSIALNIDNFKPASDDFVPRATQTYPPLQDAHAPFLSVIIPNYNGRRFLPALFSALQAQTFADFEVLLADDASTDDSVAFVEQFVQNAQEQNAASPLTVRILVNRRNVGFVSSCNMAADVARGRVLVLLNNDTEPESTWLAELARAICTNPQAGIISSKVLLFDERTRLHTAGDMMGLNGLPRNRGVWETDHGQYDHAPTIFSGSGCGAAIRKDLWDSLGGFDEDFWMYLEDVDLAFRAQLLGWEACFAPTARLYHHLSASGGDTLSSFYVGRNTIWTIAKNMPRGLLLRNLPTIVTAQLQIALEALRNIRGEAARARLWGQLAGLAGLPRQLRKRRLIQPRRVLDDAELRARLVD
ncbi:MAG: glycosyltransferase family 2 protein [Caldilineaceae bacterium]|nr:glycosyltransferase family 2 protein [Caldilineaceae bacterium]